MAVVARVVFFAVRALLALIPALAATFPIKKWSAAAARRSIMTDRRTVTFRTLVVAVTLGLVALVQIGMPRLFAVPDRSATAHAAGGHRPWSPAVGEPTEPENSTARPTAPRPVDATPAEVDLQAEE